MLTFLIVIAVLPPKSAFVYPNYCKNPNAINLFHISSKAGIAFGRARKKSYPKITSLEGYTSDERGSIVDDERMDVEDPFESLTNRTISACVSSQLPFSTSVAFDAFSDLSRQPSWTPWLSSVTYLDKEDFKYSNKLPRNENKPGRESEWTIRVKGVKFSWKAISTKIERPHIIGWESTSGLRNRGTVQFVEVSDQKCNMVIEMSFVLPRVLVKIFKKSSLIQKFFTEKMLGEMLERFTYVVMTEDLRIKLIDKF